MNSKVLLTLLAACSCAVGAARSGSQATAEARASAWLRKHTTYDPVKADEDGMKDLQQNDPTAFQVVQALLMKQKLGLLNPRHPTASFADGADAPEEHTGPSAIEVLRNAGAKALPSESLAETEVVAPPAPMPHTQGALLSWKPHSDEDMLSSVVGPAAAEPRNDDAAPAIGTASLMSQRHTTALGNDLSSWESSPATAQFLGEKKPAVGMSQQNTFLKSISFNGMYAGGAPPKQEESNALTNFDWGPLKKGDPQDARAYGMLQRLDSEASSKANSGNLGAWLHAPSQRASLLQNPAAEAAGNAYLSDLQ